MIDINKYILLTQKKVEMVHGVTTEWEDIQVKMGNYTKLEKVATGMDNLYQNIEDLEHYDPKRVMNNE